MEEESDVELLMDLYVDESLGPGLVNYENLMALLSDLKEEQSREGPLSADVRFPFDQSKTEHDINLLKQQRKLKQQEATESLSGGKNGAASSADRKLQ